MTSRAQSIMLASATPIARISSALCSGAQRIAQLVGEHREKLVLAVVDFAQLGEPALQFTLELLAVRNIAGDRHRAQSWPASSWIGATLIEASNREPFFRNRRVSYVATGSPC